LKLPATLEAHYEWTLTGSTLLDKSEFSTKSALLDNFLSNRIDAHVADVRHQLWSKLRNTNFEVIELQIFCLLLSSGLDNIIEYTKESLSKKGFNNTSTYEFRHFLGTIFLLSSLNLSIKLNRNLMQKITGDKAISNEHFNELIQNLRGFEMGIHFGEGPSSAWCDHKDKFWHFHFLEDWVLERP
jgi:hypothetical protein